MKDLILKYSVVFMSVLQIIEKLNPITIKFLVLGLFVPPIAIYMLFRDENSANPTRLDVFAAYFLSLLMIWLGYEVSMFGLIPYWAGMMASFFTGLFSLPIVLKLKNKVLDKGGIIDFLTDWVKNLINRKTP